MQYLTSIVITLIVFYTLECAFGYLRLTWKRSSTLQKINKTGMLLVTERNIMTTQMSSPVTLFEFPKESLRYIKNLSSLELSKALLELQENRLPVNAKCAITIAAALYQFYIPIQLVCLGAKTKELYIILKDELALVYVNKENLKFAVELQIKENPDLLLTRTSNYIYAERHYKYLIVIGALLLRHAAEGMYPSLENFVLVFKQHSKTKQINPYTEEIKSMITAWGVLTNSPIPKAYMKLDALAYLLTRFETKVTNVVKLSIVK